MSKICDSVIDTVGNTPIIRLKRMFPEHQVYMKIEKANPGGSIKDRIALQMIQDAESAGLITPGVTTIVEPTSGNTGVGLCWVAAVRGYKTLITMPDSMSKERRSLMSAFGAELVLTPAAKGMRGAINKAEEIQKTDPSKYWIPAQFDNPSNPKVHELYTSKEIIKQFEDEGPVDYLITGVGTGGHITGLTRGLRKAWPNMKTVAVEPKDSPVLSGGSAGPHGIQGIGAGFIPFVMDTELLTSISKSEVKDSYDMMRKVAKTEGLLCGISTGASLQAVQSFIDDMGEASKELKILTVNYDTGERYLSVEGVF